MVFRLPYYTALAWNYTVQSTCSNSLVPRPRERRDSPLPQHGYDANVAKSDGVCKFHWPRNTKQCDQPWDSSSCLPPIKWHLANTLGLIIACSWELKANFFSAKKLLLSCWSGQGFPVLESQMVFSAMWLADGKFSPDSNQAWGICQTSPDSLLLGGVCGRDWEMY